MKRVVTLMLSLWLFSTLVAAQEREAVLIFQHDSGVVTGSWNSAETEILTATEGGLARVWSAETGEPLLTIDHSGNPLTHAMWINEGAAIVSADESGLIRLSARADGEELRRWQLGAMPVALEIVADGTEALAFTDHGGGAILSLLEGGLVVEFEAASEISGAAFSADETRGAGLVGGWGGLQLAAEFGRAL